MKVIRFIFTGIPILFVFSFFALEHSADAQVRTSPNYQLQSDSVNVGGGLATSSNFIQQNTVGEMATGLATSSSFNLSAGYQQMQSVFLSLSSGANITLSPDLPGITGGESNGSTTFTVITDSPAGYQLLLTAEDDPALQRPDGAAIPDYAPVGTADFSFAIPVGAAVFGFSVEGEDIANDFRDNGSDCGIGMGDTPLRCWAGLETTATEIARSVGANHPLGATTTLHFRVGVANAAGISAGVYTATTTVTALPL